LNRVLTAKQPGDTCHPYSADVLAAARGRIAATVGLYQLNPV
jgi:hypothetical protein